MKAYKLSFETYDQSGDWDQTYFTEKNVRKAYDETKSEYKNNNTFEEHEEGICFGVDGVNCEWYETEIEGECPKPLIYLAQPYSHDDPKIVEERFQLGAKKASELMVQGNIIFSPIGMCHPMAVHGKLPGGWDFWEKFDRTYLSVCHKVIVYRLPGWETSKGVTAEIKIAQEMGIPIEYID